MTFYVLKCRSYTSIRLIVKKFLAVKSLVAPASPFVPKIRRTPNSYKTSSQRVAEM